MNRRTFLFSSAGVVGANDRIRVGLIGSGGRGQYLTANFKELGAEMAAVCDVYEPHLEAGLKAASTGARAFRNYKQLLEDRGLDAVIVATPDHWHAQMAIDAVRAGKDVYLEKPMAHNIQEGFRLVEAVRQTRRVLQVGMQRRSSELFTQAREVVKSGALGDVRLINSWWYNTKAAVRTAPLPGKLDWDQWLGPAPKAPFTPARFSDWIYFWDYGGGLLTGQGAHIVDAFHILMGSTYPAAVTASAGRVSVAGAEVPETTCLAIEYPENYLAVFTCGYKAMRYAMFNDQLKQFNGSKARFDVGRERFAVYPESNAIEMKPSIEKIQRGSFEASSRAHIRNFLECVRTRKDPNATVELGQYTNVALGMALESLRSGRRVRWDSSKKRLQ
jgi:predicted dehydrogenase